MPCGRAMAVGSPNSVTRLDFLGVSPGVFLQLGLELAHERQQLGGRVRIPSTAPIFAREAREAARRSLGEGGQQAASRASVGKPAW